MSDSSLDPIWVDLTVTNAPGVRDFYADMLGWKPMPVSMGEYEDFAMESEGQVVAGICHARGVNCGLPPVWLPYFRTESLEESLRICQQRGGCQLTAIRRMADTMRYAVIRDPAGAYAVVCEQF